MEYLVFDARGNGEGGVVPTLTGDHLNRVTDYTAIVVEIKKNDAVKDCEPHGTNR